MNENIDKEKLEEIERERKKFHEIVEKLYPKPTEEDLNKEKELELRMFDLMTKVSENIYQTEKLKAQRKESIVSIFLRIWLIGVILILSILFIVWISRSIFFG